MDNQHDEGDAEDTAPVATAPSRPDDPAVLARAAGKTTREHSSESPHQPQPSQRHNRGPPLDDDEPGERPGDDLMVGRNLIQRFLVDDLRMPRTTDPYYLKRIGWPIGNIGGDSGKLIASKRRLTRHARKLAAA